MARLRVATGRSAGKVVDVDKNAVIGRGETAQLQIADLKASREHCRVFEQGGAWAVADLNSRNGISVNGVKTTRKTLAHGDKIEIGETTVVFEVQGATETGDALPPAKAAEAKPAAAPGAADTADLPAVKVPGAKGPAPKPAAAPAKPAAAAARPAAASKPAAPTTAKAAAMAQARADAEKAKAKAAEKPKAAAATAARATGTKDSGLQISDRVLQFQKVDPRKATVMDVDLTQSDAMTKVLIVLGCVAFLGVLVWLFSTLVGE